MIRQRERSIQLFQKKIETQYTFEKVEDEESALTSIEYKIYVEKEGKAICSNTRSEMKGFATFWMVWHVLLLKHQEAENLCRAVT
jgi:hypothetical protein